MLAHVRPAPPRFTTEPRPNYGIADLGSKSEANHGPPSAQSPFARWRCYRQRRDVQRRVSGHYPTFIAPTGSCARPNPSHRLRSRPWSMGLCRWSPVPAGRWPFPTLSPQVFPQVPGPLPRRSTWCTCPFLPMWHRPSPCCERVGSPRWPCNDFRTEPISRLQPFVYLQAPGFACHPGRSYRRASRRRAAVASTSAHLAARYLTAQRIC